MRIDVQDRENYELQILDPCSTHMPISFVFDLGRNTVLNKTDDSSPIRLLVSELLKCEILTETDMRRIDVQFISYSLGIYIEEKWMPLSLYDIDAPLSIHPNYTKELNSIHAAISQAVMSARSMRRNYLLQGIQSFKPQIYYITNGERYNDNDVSLYPMDELCEKTFKQNKVKLHIMHLETKQIKRLNIPYANEYAIVNESWPSALLDFIKSKAYARPILGIEQDAYDTKTIIPI